MNLFLTRFCSLLLATFFCIQAAFSADTPLRKEFDLVVELEDGQRLEDLSIYRQIAASEPVDGLRGFYRLKIIRPLSGKAPSKLEMRRKIELVEGIRFAGAEEKRLRYPRRFDPLDPLFAEQWHLENIGQTNGKVWADGRIRDVWDADIKGEGVVIAIVDTGTQFNHPDLSENWLSGSGKDFNGKDNIPLPEESNEGHGTSVAGIALASSNSIGGLGVAYKAGLVPVRLISGPITSSQEGEALVYMNDQVDIYNNSWGPSDNDGVRFAGGGYPVQSALEQGTTFGRKGLGSIYVWAAGNGGLNDDNSNYDGFNASPYTISVGASGHDDRRAGYSEKGSNLLVVAPSQGRGPGIFTTDLTGTSGYSSTDYFSSFNGTSAAAPFVTGVVALLLQARPDLYWWEVQEILALTAVPVDLDTGDWEKNGSGKWISESYGFGRVDAAAAIRLAKQWPEKPLLSTISRDFTGRQTLAQGRVYRKELVFPDSLLINLVSLKVQLNHSNWGDLDLKLISPEGTVSQLISPHLNATTSNTYTEWTFSSTRYLGENSQGTWTVEISDVGSNGSGTMNNWTVQVMGTVTNPLENLPPVADDLNISSSSWPLELNLLEGVTDPDGDPLEIISVDYPEEGILNRIGDDRVYYTMSLSTDNSDRFSALIGDGRGGVYRRIFHINNPHPAAVNDFFVIQSGKTVELPVLANDYDVDGDALEIVGLEGGRFGRIELQNNKLTYTSSAGLAGVDRLRYTITDNSSGSSSGNITVVTDPDPDIVLSFDGVDDQLLYGAGNGLNITDDFTFSAWINPKSYGEAATGFGRLFDKETVLAFINGSGHSFYAEQSLVCYFVLANGEATAANTDPGTIKLNECQHIAIAFKSSESTPVKVWIDGQLQNLSYPIEGTVKPTSPIASNLNDPLYFGESSSGERAFSGEIGSILLESKVITATDVLLRMNNPSFVAAETQIQFDFADSLLGTVKNVGLSGGFALLQGAMRIPRVYPWANFELSFDLVLDGQNGWWVDRTLGWVYGDDFPWIYYTPLGWTYSTGNVLGSGFYLLPVSTGQRWFYTSPKVYPFFYDTVDNNWIWYLEGTNQPSWFYRYSKNGEEDWVPFPQGFFQ